MLTKKDLIKALEEIPEDAVIVPHEKPSDWNDDCVAMVGYDAEKNEIRLFDYFDINYV